MVLLRFGCHIIRVFVVLLGHENYFNDFLERGARNQDAHQYSRNGCECETGQLADAAA